MSSTTEVGSFGQPTVTADEVLRRLLAHQSSDGWFRPPAPDGGRHRPPDQQLWVADQAGLVRVLALATGRGFGGIVADRAVRMGAATLADRMVTHHDGSDLIAISPFGLPGQGDEVVGVDPVDDGIVVELSARVLSALTTVERYRPGTVALSDLRALGRFVLHAPAQVPARSDGAAGWTVLGLAGLAALTGDATDWCPVVDRLLAVYSARSDDPPTIPEGRVLLATSEVLGRGGDMIDPDRRERLERWLRWGSRRVVTEVLTVARLTRTPSRHGPVGPTAELIEALRAVGRAIDLGPLAGPVDACIETGVASVLNRLRLEEHLEDNDATIDHLAAAVVATVTGRSTGPTLRRTPTSRPAMAGPRIDVRPHLLSVEEALTAAGSGPVAVRPVVADTNPGLFRLALDVAASLGEVLYRAEIRVVSPGRHVDHPSPADRWAWACRRTRVVLSAHAGLTLEAGPTSFRLAPGELWALGATDSHQVDNTNSTPLVLLDVTSRPTPTSRAQSPFDLVTSEVDVASLVAEIERLPDLEAPAGETARIVLRKGRRPPAHWRQVPPDRQSFHPTGALSALPRLQTWLDGFCRDRALEPGRASVVALVPGGHVPAHVDHGPYHRLADRHHLILQGGATTIQSGGVSIEPQPGELWRFDNQLLHQATNRGLDRSVHLVFDATAW